MTGINQNASEITLSNCEELGTDLVEVSAHLGAREEHAEWQGKIYCLNGERDYLDSEGNIQHAQNFYEVCKFGEPTGICGINCRHSYYPYFEGTEKQYSDKELDEYKDNKVSFEDEEGKKHEITQYEAEQMLRGYERNIRKYKTEADAFFESGFGDSPEALKAKSKIREWQGKAKDLCKQTGIRRDYAREYIGTVSGKQPTGIKNISQDKNFGIVKNYNQKSINEKQNAVEEWLIRKGIESNKERIVLTDTEGNIKQIQKGEEHSVVLSKSMNEIIKNSVPNSLILNHNHPSNGSFSEEDLRLINRNISIKTISAIGHNENKYYIHIPDDKRISDEELKKNYKECEELAKKETLEKFNNKQLAFEEINFHYWDLTLKLLAKKLEWIYKGL